MSRKELRQKSTGLAPERYIKVFLSRCPAATYRFRTEFPGRTPCEMRSIYVPPNIRFDHDRRRASLIDAPERGRRGPQSSVSDDQAAEARYDYWYRGVAQPILAERLGKTQAWVSMLVNFKVLRHVV